MRSDPNVGINNQQVRSINCGAVMRQLYRYKSLSKSQLSRQVCLTIPAISKILAQLQEQGLVIHQKNTGIQRGNSSGTYQATLSSHDIICMQVSPKKISALIVDSNVNLLLERFSIEIEPTNPEQFIECIEQVYWQCKQKAHNKPLKLALALHGVVDIETGASRVMPQAPWSELVEVKYILENRLGIDIEVDNDCVMITLAEKWINHNNYENFCVINVDYGVGSSFVIQHEVFRGQLYGSGQIGHTVVDPDGRRCGCGRYGCLETVASTNAIISTVRARLKTDVDFFEQKTAVDIEFSDCLERYHAGDPLVVSIVDHAARVLGLSLYNFFLTLNVNYILLYGEACKFGDVWIEKICSQAYSNPFEDSTELARDKASIRVGALNDTEILMGIGYAFIEQKLKTLKES
ncbi:ROK family protein [Vibrio sp. 10N.261.51.F12]|uniref:ROK family protein n=1 Tax=Vibrio sp. 10N.261.51.F12 TaxID=3229679 RepID=UPI0035513EF8